MHDFSYIYIYLTFSFKLISYMYINIQCLPFQIVFLVVRIGQGEGVLYKLLGGYVPLGF